MEAAWSGTAAWRPRSSPPASPPSSRTSTRFEDAAATAFARELYAQLAAGSALGDAAREARVAVGREHGTSSLGWAVPVVFARDPREPLR